MKNSKLSFVAFIGLLFAGCATSNSTLTLTSFDSGKQVILAVGQVFLVQLPSNSTTGYRWNEANKGEAAVKGVGEPSYIIGAAPIGMVGTGGTETWTFRAIKTGQETLRLEYSRPFEKDLAPAQTVAFDLVVK